jgi:hypothetical protein
VGGGARIRTVPDDTSSQRNSICPKKKNHPVPTMVWFFNVGIPDIPRQGMDDFFMTSLERSCFVGELVDFECILLHYVVLSFPSTWVIVDP